MSEQISPKFASTCTLILGSEESSAPGFLPVEIGQMLVPGSESLSSLNYVPFEYDHIYAEFFRQSKRKAYNLGTGWLIEGFVPRQIVENNSTIVLYFSVDVPIPNGNRIGLVDPKYKFMSRKINLYESQREAFYVKLVPKSHFELIPRGNTLMSKVAWLRKKFRHRYVHLLFYLFYCMNLPNLSAILNFMEKEASNVTRLEVGLYEMLHLRLTPFQLIPEFLKLPFFDKDSEIVTAFADLFGLSNDELMLKLVAKENFNYVDLIRFGTTFKDNFNDRNGYIWNLIHYDCWKTKKFPYNWVDMMRNIAEQGTKEKTVEDLVNIEKLIRWNFAKQNEDELYDIFNDAITLKAKINGNISIKAPIQFYHFMNISPEKGDTTIKETVGGYTVNGVKYDLPGERTQIFNVIKP